MESFTMLERVENKSPHTIFLDGHNYIVTEINKEIAEGFVRDGKAVVGDGRVQFTAQHARTSGCAQVIR